MPRTTIVRLSVDRADRIRERATTQDRLPVTELERLVDTGFAVQEAIDDGRLPGDFLTKLSKRKPATGRGAKVAATG